MRIFLRGSGLAVLAAAVVALSGCGEDEPAGSAAGDSPPAAAETTSVTRTEDETPDPTEDTATQPAPSAPSAPATPPAETANPPAAEATITIQDFAYGDPLTVQPGQTITVVNQDSAQHDVDALDGTSFMTDLLAQGESTTFTAPATPGTYDFTCSNHPQMLGQLIVAG